MKAVVKYGDQDGMVELREVPEPEIGEEDVLLEVRAAGVCGSDIEMWRHAITFPVRTPVIQGHEFAGVIAQKGKKVMGFEVGERVVSETAAYICGRCRLCRTGEYNLCRERRGFGAMEDGAFTKYVRVPERCLHRLPDGVPFEHGCLTEPACVAYNALVVKSRILPDETVVVLGAGPIGLFAVQLARACGAGRIVLSGTSADIARMKVGEQVGADLTIDSETEDPVAVVRELTCGEGAPLVVDAAGSSATLAQSMAMVAPGGQITKIGWGPKPVGFSLDSLVQKAARLQGTFSHNWPTWEKVLSMIASGAVQMKPMITEVLGIEEWERAYRMVEERKAVKVVLHPQEVTR